jgi:hypothetical protein
MKVVRKLNILPYESGRLPNIGFSCVWLLEVLASGACTLWGTLTKTEAGGSSYIDFECSSHLHMSGSFVLGSRLPLHQTLFLSSTTPLETVFAARKAL